MSNARLEHLSTGNSTRPFKRPRSFMKCQSCRERKSKCLPLSRNWENGERCDRCIQLGRDCGPNERHGARHDSTDATPAALNDSNDTNDIPVLSIDPTDQHVLRPDTVINFDEFLTNVEAICPAETTSFGSTSLVGSSVPTPALRMFAGQHTEVCEQLNSLHDLLGVVESLQQQYDGMLSAGETTIVWSPRLHIVRQSLEAIMNHACDQFSRTCTKALDSISELMPLDQKYQLRLLLDCVMPFRANCGFSILRSEAGVAEERRDDSMLCQHVRVLEALIGLCDTQGESAEADRYCCALMKLDEYDVSSNKPELRPRLLCALQNISQRRYKTFRSLSIPRCYNPVLRPSNNVFPAEHIAICLGQNWAFNELTQANDSSGMQHNILEQNSAHVASKLNNVEILKTTQQQTPEQLTARDILQSTPVILAVKAGSVECVELLTTAVPTCKDDRDLLSRGLLAIARDASQFRIENILRRQGFVGSYKEDIDLARQIDGTTFLERQPQLISGVIDEGLL